MLGVLNRWLIDMIVLVRLPAVNFQQYAVNVHSLAIQEGSFSLDTEGVLHFYRQWLIYIDPQMGVKVWLPYEFSICSTDRGKLAHWK